MGILGQRRMDVRRHHPPGIFTSKHHLFLLCEPGCSYRWVPPCLCQLLSALPRCTHMSSTGQDECPSSMHSCPLDTYALGLTASCCLGLRWPCRQHWFPHCWFLRRGPVGIPGPTSCSIATMWESSSGAVLYTRAHPHGSLSLWG